MVRDILSVSAHKILATSAFRMALLYMLLFSASVSLLLGYVYWSTVGYLNSRTDEAVVGELEMLIDQYRSSGLGSLIRAVDSERHPGENIYLLVGPDGMFLAGTLDIRPLPSHSRNRDNWIEFEHRRPGGGPAEIVLARARATSLPGGLHLLVGRDVRDQREIERLITGALAWSLGLTVFLGLAGGVAVGRNMLRRIDAINWSIRSIMEGDLSRRLPTHGIGDELDRLAHNVNNMIDRIESLMQGMREVSDDIAHDLRSPLNRMRSRLEIGLMAKGEGGNATAEQRRALQDAIGEIDELLRLFDSMLSIARLETCVEEDRWEILDLAVIAREVGELYAPAAEEQDEVLAFDMEGPLEIRGVRELLAQAISNLIENAIHYGGGEGGNAGERGRIEVRGRCEGEDVFLEVRDRGRGIPAQERERVFDRFIRLEPSRNTSGSGLGLSLVRAVARRHGGDACIKDANPGCRVVLRFPSADSVVVQEELQENDSRKEGI